MSGAPFRINPQMGPEAYKTYSIRAPHETHWRPASCEDIDCGPYLYGWVTILPAGSDRIALVKRSGRHFVEYRDTLPDTVAARLPDADPENPGARELGPGLVAFYFEPGQACFEAASHTIRLDRRELYLVTDGDWRGNPRGGRVGHSGPDAWVDDFGTHQDRLSRQIERG